MFFPLLLCRRVTLVQGANHVWSCVMLTSKYHNSSPPILPPFTSTDNSFSKVSVIVNLTLPRHLLTSSTQHSGINERSRGRWWKPCFSLHHRDHDVWEEIRHPSSRNILFAPYFVCLRLHHHSLWYVRSGSRYFP